MSRFVFMALAHAMLMIFHPKTLKISYRRRWGKMFSAMLLPAQQLKITAIVEKNEKLYSEKLFNLAETDYTPNYDEGRGLGYLVVDGRYKQTGKLFPKGSFGHCGHCGQSFFISREKNMYVILLTNATRFAAMKNDFKHYDYGITMKMREDVHNAIYKDLTEEEVLK